MSVRIDAAPPTVAYAAPAHNSFTADTTPSFSWTANDDSCAARVELTVGANVYVLGAGTTSFDPTTVLPEGPTTWSLRVFDSAGNITTAGAPRTINIDTTPPSGITATFPANGATVPEGMLTFDWSNGTDGAGSGVARYDLIIDGAPAASNIIPSTSGTHQALGPANLGDAPVPHTWSIRVFDAVGNSAVFPFSFSASFLADVTPPSTFNLLTPADSAAVPAGTPLTWQAAWDFKGVTQYRVYIDGQLAATTAGNVTTFTPAAGTGSPICPAIDYDGVTSNACLNNPRYSYGTGATTTASGLVASPHINTASYAGWNAGGNALGVGNPTITPITNPASGFDGDKVWTAVEYATTIPASGGDIRVEHRYRTHTIGQRAFDGGTIEIKVDNTGNGFGDDAWASTCEFNAKALYGTTLDCVHQIVDLNGGYTAIMGGASKTAHPIAKQHAFAGNSGGTVSTRLAMTAFAGKNVLIRFRIGTDSCWAGMPAGATLTFCNDAEVGAPGFHPVQWRIDNVTLANSALLPGAHTWHVEARDAAGNSRFSNQTWTFNLM
jgi:hypothetical protein